MTGARAASPKRTTRARRRPRIRKPPAGRRAARPKARKPPVPVAVAEEEVAVVEEEVAVVAEITLVDTEEGEEIESEDTEDDEAEVGLR